MSLFGTSEILNAPMGSTATVRLQPEHLERVYTAMTTYWSNVVMAGYDHDLQDNTILTDSIINAVGELVVTLETPAMGGTFVLPNAGLPTHSPPPHLPEPLNPKQAKVDKLVGALRTRPILLSKVLEGLQTDGVYLVGPWRKKKLTGTGDKDSWQRWFIQGEIAAEVTYDPYYEKHPPGVNEVALPWTGDVWPNPDHANHHDFLPEIDNGFSETTSTAERAKAWCDGKLRSLGVVLFDPR